MSVVTRWGFDSRGRKEFGNVKVDRAVEIIWECES